MRTGFRPGSAEAPLSESPPSVLPARDSEQALQELADRLRRAERIAVLAVGSELRGDDAAGLLVGEAIGEPGSEQVRVFFGGTAPENCTGPIRQFQPTHLVIVDAAELGELPGSIRIIDPDRIAGISFATHALPMSVVSSYLVRSVPGCEIIVVGIQPAAIAFGEPPGQRVQEAAARVANAIRAALASSGA